MKIDLKKITTNLKDFSMVNERDISFSGKFFRTKDNLINIEAMICGKEMLICDRCGKEFESELNEEILVSISEGIYSGDEDDVIEVFSNELDFDEILTSEIELIKSDYHYCTECDNLENFEAEY